MTIAAIVERATAVEERRQDIRWRMRLELPGLLKSGQANVIVHDLSTAGMLVETGSGLQIGQSISIDLPEAHNATAQVVWQNERLFGCRFDQPLSQAAVSATRLRNPPEKEQVPASPSGEREALSDRLVRLRRAQGMSRAALSVRTGFSKPTIWAWETGKTVPRRANLLVLAEVLGLSAEQLVFGDGSTAEAAAKDYPTSRLRHAIAEARSGVALIAGVDESKVRISIEF